MSIDAHPQLPDDSVPKRDDSHNIKRLPCCLYLEDSEGKTLIKLNESSSLVWSLCTGEFTVKEMIDLLKRATRKPVMSFAKMFTGYWMSFLLKTS